MITADLDALADSLGIPTRRLKQQLADLGLAHIVSEAQRLAFCEVFDDLSQPRVRLLNPPCELRHLVAAARSTLPS